MSPPLFFFFSWFHVFVSLIMVIFSSKGKSIFVRPSFFFFLLFFSWFHMFVCSFMVILFSSKEKIHIRSSLFSFSSLGFMCLFFLSWLFFFRLRENPYSLVSFLSESCSNWTLLLWNRIFRFVSNYDDVILLFSVQCYAKVTWWSLNQS